MSGRLRLAVYGAGGVGGYFGGLLAHASHEVHFIARGAHLQALRQNGLTVHSVHGDFAVRPALATDDPAEVGPVDYVLVAVKHYHLPEVLPRLPALVGSETTVAPLLNGVDAHEHLIQAVGPEPVIGGLCAVVSFIEAPGVIRQVSQVRRVVLGELDGRKSERVERLVQALAEAGAEAIHADDIHAALWTKFLFIASLGAVTALSRATSDQVMATEPTRELFRRAMAEVAALARARGVRLREDVVERWMRSTAALGPGSTTSMQRDVAEGRPFELEAFSGTVVRLGKEAGVPTPLHETFYALLRPALDRAMGEN